MIVANLGDSRAVLCPPDSKDCLILVQLTTDLKPDLPSELTRILNYKGRVFAIDDESDVSLTFSLLLNWMQVKD